VKHVHYLIVTILPFQVVINLLTKKFCIHGFFYTIFITAHA